MRPTILQYPWYEETALRVSPGCKEKGFTLARIGRLMESG